MRRSEAEIFWDEWNIGFSKVFSYRQEFLPIDYICLRKEKDSLIIEQNTSKTLVNFDKDIIMDLMCKELLEHKMGHSSYMSMMDLKTNGCSCGAWILGDDTHHDSICIKNKFSGWRG